MKKGNLKKTWLVGRKAFPAGKQAAAKQPLPPKITLIGRRHFESANGAKMRIVSTGGRKATITLPDGSHHTFLCKRSASAGGFTFLVVKVLPRPPGSDPRRQAPNESLRLADKKILEAFKEVLIKRFGWPNNF